MLGLFFFFFFLICATLDESLNVLAYPFIFVEHEIMDEKNSALFLAHSMFNK